MHCMTPPPHGEEEPEHHAHKPEECEAFEIGRNRLMQ